MSKIKWIMKQYWRVGTVRALASLVLGMLVLGRYYYIYVPGLSDLAWIGAVTLGVALTLIFLGIGWLYDVKARMWTQKVQAAIERDPYYYIPNFRNMAAEYPILYVLINTIKGILSKLNIDSESVDDLTRYMQSFFSSRPVKSDLLRSQKDAERFLENLPFQAEYTDRPSRIPLRNRVKLGWEIQM
ncbi:MAG: hypothetical protein ACFFAY_16505, partial [Promethearchaeota archaeon]